MQCSRGRAALSYIVLSRDEFRSDELSTSANFEGYPHNDTNVSFIWVDLPPGDGPRLRQHPYEEVFIVLEGHVTFTVDAATIAATVGQVHIAPPNTPHKFVNSGDGPLRQIDIHASKRFITEWLEDE
ncbi:MAG: cupin domain-containing protein [Ktedonobacterales bacterium]